MRAMTFILISALMGSGCKLALDDKSVGSSGPSGPAAQGGGSSDVGPELAKAEQDTERDCEHDIEVVIDEESFASVGVDRAQAEKWCAVSVGSFGKGSSDEIDFADPGPLTPGPGLCNGPHGRAAFARLDTIECYFDPDAKHNLLTFAVEGKSARIGFPERPANIHPDTFKWANVGMPAAAGPNKDGAIPLIEKRRWAASAYSLEEEKKRMGIDVEVEYEEFRDADPEIEYGQIAGVCSAALQAINGKREEGDRAAAFQRRVKRARCTPLTDSDNAYKIDIDISGGVLEIRYTRKVANVRTDTWRWADSAF